MKPTRDRKRGLRRFSGKPRLPQTLLCKPKVDNFTSSNARQGAENTSLALISSFARHDEVHNNLLDITSPPHPPSIRAIPILRAYVWRRRPSASATPKRWVGFGVVSAAVRSRYVSTSKLTRSMRILTFFSSLRQISMPSHSLLRPLSSPLPMRVPERGR
jgi:hypothetical protein